MVCLRTDIPPDHPMWDESGGHRLQRWVARTNRVQASTVTVFVALEEGKGDGFVLREADVAREWYSGTGAGGQHRNKTQNSLRLRHLPTGMVVSAQHRSRQESEAAAWSQMEARLRALHAARAHEEVAVSRRAAVGTGAKADKRRTYRERDDRVQDHASGRQARLRDLWSGDWSALWGPSRRRTA